MCMLVYVICVHFIYKNVICIIYTNINIPIDNIMNKALGPEYF